jgi:hypothetical protein
MYEYNTCYDFNYVLNVLGNVTFAYVDVFFVLTWRTLGGE